MRPRERRYPLADLIAALGVTDRQAMELLRLSGSLRTRLHRDGLTLDQAERYALRVGLHPFEVWHDMPDALIDPTGAYATVLRRLHGSGDDLDLLHRLNDVELDLLIAQESAEASVPA